MTHAATQKEVKKALENAKKAYETKALNRYIPRTEAICRVDIPAMAERINKMVETLEVIAKGGRRGFEHEETAIAALADYRQDSPREQTCSHND